MLQWLEWELFGWVLEESSKLKVILSIETGLDCNIILDKFKELLLKLVDLLSHEEWVDEGKVRITEIPIIPYLLCHQQRAQDQWSPIGWMQWHLGKGNQSIDIHQAYDTALRTKFSTIIQSLHKLGDVVTWWGVSQKGNPLLIKLVWLLFDVLLLTEEVKLPFLVKFFPVLLILLESFVRYSGGDLPLGSANEG